MKLCLLDRHRSENFTYHDTSFLTSLLTHFNACRHDNRFTDLEVEVKGVVFPCHQILMDAFCPYFMAHFSFSERRGEVVVEGDRGVRQVERVSLKYEGVTVEGFSRLLDFMYTAELEVTMDNVIDIMRCADFLQFHHVVHLCSTLLHQHVTPDTCLQVLVIAEAHDLHDLAEKALDFILSNIARVTLQEEFTQLSKEVLVRIVSHPRLQVTTESTVLEAVLLWVNSREKERHSLLPELLQHARLKSLDEEELMQGNVKSAEIFGKDLGSVDDIIKNSQSLEEEKEDLTESCPASRLRETLVVVSRKTDYVTASRRKLDWRKVYTYNPVTKLWEHHTTLPFSQREGYTVTVVGNRMHVTGGQSISGSHGDKMIFDDHVVFSPLDGKWGKRQHMLVPRFHHSAAAMLDRLYVVGGQNSSNASDLRADGEVYNSSTDQWSFISPVRCVSGIGNAALTSLNGKLYILGGVYDSRRHQRNAAMYDNFSGAQIYDPERDLWQELVPLERQIAQRSLRLSSGGALTVDGLLILLDDDIGKSHHIYNPVSQTLSPLMQAHGHHWFAGWAVFQGRLVSTGGLEKGQLGMTDMVHAWDLTSEVKGWDMMPSLPKPLANHACVTLHFPDQGSSTAV